MTDRTAGMEGRAMTEPTTEAGRALAEALPRFFRAHAYWRDFEPSVPDRIRRIEAEAAAAERDRIRAAPLDVERLARALDKVWRDDGWEPTHPNSRLPAEEAERIAREYEREP